LVALSVSSLGSWRSAELREVIVRQPEEQFIPIDVPDDRKRSASATKKTLRA
jgi:hypothetical protein